MNLEKPTTGTTPQQAEAASAHSESTDQAAEPEVVERRSFLGVLLGVGTVSVGALLAVPLVRFALHPTRAKTTETEWADLGPADRFANITAPVKRVVTIEQRDGWRKTVAEKSVYVVKDADGKARVLSAVCPHLGCTVAWNEAKGQFVSPCHNGIFRPDGTLISGPPRRSMDELESKVEEGRLKVRYQFFRQLVATKEVIG
jgi:menaquinol-cytochrome c reductase iron-sulfur subunit